MHLQTSMSSPGFEPSPYGIAVSVANQLGDTQETIVLQGFRVKRKMQINNLQAEDEQTDVPYIYNEYKSGCERLTPEVSPSPSCLPEAPFTPNDSNSFTIKLV
ncbi:hypothetical protein TNCV_332401 [Trichonephila clavipes]|nr:hypothetical protein TNCV_332401 [Trichonephila clavipes]